ncbi:HAD hydrolase [Blastocystis sp. subtype 4]|uniref:HAD hydrolase n=1 Tax=Blastocystis sp. subtype 4 TaxID=944170 RepID=UPI00071140BB|nr:HAD hydrolase [Blastocystis sp. subtype 4]KNB46554.1 HAD hydrolase [Blastocystis sp. subtype 4]|eukprot:XP_014529997.1 HAD hydrolase [Blastocystis sp. subtype 4]
MSNLLNLLSLSLGTRCLKKTTATLYCVSDVIKTILSSCSCMDEDMIPHISKLPTNRIQNILKPIKGVIFDVDGTLTVPGLINYKRIHEKANIPIGEDIVPYIRSHYSGEEYQRAMKIVEEEELLGQKNVQLQPGADELIHLLNCLGIRVALLTRNSQRCLENTLCLFTSKIDLAYSRDIQPSKPNVDPFVRIGNEWSVPCESLLLAGDHLDDFIAALALSSRSCYVRPHYDTSNPATSHKPQLVHNNALSLANCQQCPPYIMEYKRTHNYYVPDLVVDSISELCQAWYNVSQSL